jgi:hypothetical protein
MVFHLRGRMVGDYIDFPRRNATSSDNSSCDKNVRDLPWPRL